MPPNKSTPRLSYLVLYTQQMQEMVEFYTTLGLDFRPEQHGTGPLHYTAMISDIVLEIYPAAAGPISRTRLGLAWANSDLQRCAADVRRKLIAAPSGRCLLRDPDGNAVEVSLAESGASPSNLG